MRRGRIKVNTVIFKYVINATKLFRDNRFKPSTYSIFLSNILAFVCRLKYEVCLYVEKPIKRMTSHFKMTRQKMTSQ